MGLSLTLWVPGAANSRTLVVLDDAVATEDGVGNVQTLHHVRGLQLPEAHDWKLTAGYKKWAATSHSCEDDTPTHIHTQDFT